MCPNPVFDDVLIMDENDNEIKEENSFILREVYFQCPFGYSLFGSSEAVCSTDGTWKYSDGIEPSCLGEQTLFSAFQIIIFFLIRNTMWRYPFG